MVISHVMLLHIYQKHWPINRCYEIFGKKNKKEQIKTKTKHVKVVAGRSLRIQLGNHSYTQWRWRWCCFQWQKKRIWKKRKRKGNMKQQNNNKLQQVSFFKRKGCHGLNSKFYHFNLVWSLKMLTNLFSLHQQKVKNKNIWNKINVVF